MDISTILVAVVGINIAMILWRSIFILPLKYNLGWIVVALLIAAVMGGLWAASQQEWAGVVGLGLWVLLVLAPAYGSRLIARLFNAGRYDAAIRLAQGVSLLHPADGYPQQPDILRAYQREAAGDTSGASVLLERLLQHPIVRFLVAGQYFRLTNQYDALLDWLRINATPADFQRNPPLLDAYLRALTVTGDLNKALAEFERYKSTLERDQGILFVQYLLICANAGRDAEVQALLNGVFAHYPAPIKLSWLAIADFANGRIEAGEQKLVEMLASTNGLAHQSARRLQNRRPAVAAEVLTPESLAIVNRVAHEALQSSRYAPKKQRVPFVTLALILVNSVIFLMETRMGGAENVRTLYELGALWPPAVLRNGETWRLFNAIFLHFGLAHLVLNMLALYVLGRFVESILGWLRYLIVYFAAGLGSTLFVLALYQAGLLEVGIYVGASGAIMGMVGATAAIYLRDLRKGRSQVALRGLRSAVMIVVLQTMLDLLVTETSLEGHLSGAVIGFIAALVVLMIPNIPVRIPRLKLSR